VIHSSIVVFNLQVYNNILQLFLFFCLVIVILILLYQFSLSTFKLKSLCEINFYLTDVAVPESRKDPCTPSPCGPNSQCRNIEDHAVCSCLRGYLGSPPSCRPECVVSSECPPTRACVNKKCTDPCLASCGLNARCEVINHSPICSCLPTQTGDPFKSCYDIPSKN